MTAQNFDTRTRDPRWRLLIWGVPAALLTLPAIAMRFTPEVDWTPSDFVVMGAMLAITAGSVDALTARAGSLAHKLAAVLAVLGIFLLVWVNLAVGMIGNEGDPANLMFAAVIATIIGGGFVSHLKPRGMAIAMLTAAGLQGLAAAIALAMGWGSYSIGWPKDVIVTSGFMGLIWLASAALYRTGR